MMRTRNMVKQGFSLILSGLLVVVVISVSLLAVSLTITVLGHVLSYVSNGLFQEYSMSTFQYVLVMLVIACTAGLAIPLLLLARNIQRSVESFSLLQFDDEDELEEEEELEGDDVDMLDDDEEFNDFLRKLHKSRNIGPFIPSPKTMDDQCPCGSGLKYKDCCGKSWS